jgi:hypothetical protein
LEETDWQSIIANIIKLTDKNIKEKKSQNNNRVETVIKETESKLIDYASDSVKSLVTKTSMEEAKVESKELSTTSLIAKFKLKTELSKQNKKRN